MRTRGAASLAVGVLALTACGALHLGAHVPGTAASSGSTVASGPRGSDSPYPSPPGAGASPAQPLPSPTLAASGPCRVPVAYLSEAYGWFVTYPGGQHQDDPSSVVALPGGIPGQIGANPGLTYDRAAGLWLPVPYEWVAPSGHIYAYQDSQGISAVSLPDGAPSVVAPGGVWSLIDTENVGVYVTSPPKPGAWFIPFGGQPRQVVDHGAWQRFFAGALWGLDGNNSGQLVRHELNSGAETVWTTFTGFEDVIGFDWLGNPLVGGSASVPGSDNNPYKLVIVHSDGSRTTIWSGNGATAGGRAIGDTHGVWFEVGGGLVGTPGHGLYLWTPTSGAQLVSSEEGNLGGGCW